MKQGDEKMKNKKKILYSIIEMIVVVAITVGVFKFVVIPVRIDGVSMENTLHDNSIALINAIGVKEENIQRFDIVVLYSEALQEKIIKRVIGLPGETIEFKDDILYVNDQVVEQSFLNPDFVNESKTTYNTDKFTEDFKAVVGEGEYFVMGDNRLRSQDSRGLGSFTIDDIIGMRGVVIFPFSSIQWID